MWGKVGMVPWVHLLLASVDHPSLECGIVRYSLFARMSEGKRCRMSFLGCYSATPIVVGGLPNPTPSRNKGVHKQTGDMAGNKACGPKLS